MVKEIVVWDLTLMLHMCDMAHETGRLFLRSILLPSMATWPIMAMWRRIRI